jgi:predicted ATP-binding protein involved in virulence
MKICSLQLHHINQFRDFHLDLTYPTTHPTKAGQPLDKICFIGSNGTGKSTLLEIIKKLQERYQAGDALFHNFSDLYKGKGSIRINYKIRNHILRNNISLRTSNSTLSSNYITPKDTEIDLLIHAPAESTQNFYKNGIPNVTVDESLKLFDYFPTTHIVSNDTINDFWKTLIYLIKKREGDFRAFESREENLDKTVRQVQEEFGQSNPKILDKIATLWNKILDKAGLEFDVEGASNPIQLTDNLNAYIKLKGTDQTIPYSNLSTGIRNFIFRVGHIYRT